MRKSTRRVVFLYIPLLILMGSCTAWIANARHKTVRSTVNGLSIVNVQPEELQSLSTVENALKIDVGVDKLTDTEVTFHVAMESYQNLDAINADPLKTTILTIQRDIPFKPVRWKEIKHDDYHREGYLTFILNRRPTVLKLSIFEMEERVFEWELEPGSSE
jgi:hypothetical protein